MKFEFIKTPLCKGACISCVQIKIIVTECILSALNTEARRAHAVNLDDV